jgi:hypothetical protein
VNPSGAAGEARWIREPEWVEAIRAGHGSAFEALFHAQHVTLCTFTYRFVGQLAR